MWPIVLVFHHKPMPMSAMEGANSNSNPWAKARLTSSASHLECRNTPVALMDVAVAFIADAATGVRRLLILSFVQFRDIA